MIEIIVTCAICLLLLAWGIAMVVDLIKLEIQCKYEMRLYKAREHVNEIQGNNLGR